MKSMKIFSAFMFFFLNITLTHSFYLGGQLSIHNLILKKDNYSLKDFNLEMNEIQTIINFDEALSTTQTARIFNLDCKQEGPIADLDLINIIQRCTQSGKITADEITITKAGNNFNEFNSNKEPLGFLFSKVLSETIEDSNQAESTVINEIELLINKNKFELELVINNIKPKIKGEIYVNAKTIKVKIISAKVSVISIKAKLLAEIKKMEGGKYQLTVTDDVIEITL